MNYLILAVSIFFMDPSISNLTLDLQHSQLSWKGSAAFNSYTQKGNLRAKEGGITLRDDTILNAKIVVDMQTLEAENKQLEKHLRGKDFFEVGKFEIATFEFTEPTTINSQELIGQLTIKGITKEIALPAEITKESIGIRVKGVATIDRTQFGITFNSPNIFKKLKENAIADEFELAFSVLFVSE